VSDRAECRVWLLQAESGRGASLDEIRDALFDQAVDAEPVDARMLIHAIA
jgi:hypothetical protein